MDVVNAVAGSETEHLVGGPVLWAPSRTVRVQPAGPIGEQPLDVNIELVDEVVSGAGEAGRGPTHVAAIEHSSPLVIQGEAAGLRLHVLLAVFNR